MISKTIDKSQIEEAKTQYRDTVKHKETYILDKAVFIENKRKKIRLNESSTLADLCFALEMKDGCNILMFEDVIDLMVQPIQKDQYQTCELLIKLMDHPALIDRLNIDYNLLAKVTQEFVDEMRFSSVPIEKPFKKISDYMYIVKCSSKLFREMSSQINPEIRAKDQIQFVMSLYAKYKHQNYNYKGDDERIYASHYKAVDTIRIRALKKQT